VVFEYAIALVLWFVVPFLIALVELPVAVVRSLFSRRRWIDARSDDASPITILWSADREVAAGVADELAARLGRGYEDLTPEGAELVEMSEPPGARDLTQIV
jgi:hypothetical protein